MTTNSDSLFDCEQAAEYLGVTPRMVRRLVQERQVPSVRIGKHVRLRRSALDTYLDTQTTPARKRTP